MKDKENKERSCKNKLFWNWLRAQNVPLSQCRVTTAFVTSVQNKIRQKHCKLFKQKSKLSVSKENWYLFNIWQHQK